MAARSLLAVLLCFDSAAGARLGRTGARDSPRASTSMLANERVFTRATKFDASDFGGKSEWPYSGLDLARMDESADMYFYQEPRFVTHIDDGAIAALTAYYSQAIAPNSDVLDLCSSWISHLPEEVALKRVVGLGMNARELEANPALSEWGQADLNTEPKLPFEDESFDYVLNVVSVDYLSRPKEVSSAHTLPPPGLEMGVCHDEEVSSAHT